MTILVTGARGTASVAKLSNSSLKRGADVRVLVRDPAKARLPGGAHVAQGDLLDVDSMRSAFSGCLARCSCSTR